MIYFDAIKKYNDVTWLNDIIGMQTRLRSNGLTLGSTPLCAAVWILHLTKQVRQKCISTQFTTVVLMQVTSPTYIF